MHLAASGIDVWRIQLHGRWGSSAVLRYVRLSPLASSISQEAALGRDLSKIQDKLKQAKLQLAQAQNSTMVPTASDAAVEAIMGADLFESVGVLGRPSVDDLLIQQQGWNRQPDEREVLVVNEETYRFHALRPPVVDWPEEALGEQLLALQEAQAKTWCGWRVSAVRSKRQHAQSLAVWTPALALMGQLCPRCFGKPPDKDGSESSVSSQSSAS